MPDHRSVTTTMAGFGLNPSRLRRKSGYNLIACRQHFKVCTLRSIGGRNVGTATIGLPYRFGGKPGPGIVGPPAGRTGATCHFQALPVKCGSTIGRRSLFAPGFPSDFSLAANFQVLPHRKHDPKSGRFGKIVHVNKWIERGSERPARIPVRHVVLAPNPVSFALRALLRRLATQIPCSFKLTFQPRGFGGPRL